MEVNELMEFIDGLDIHNNNKKTFFFLKQREK